MSQQSEAGSKYLLRIRNAAQIVTVCSQQERVLRGAEMKTITILDSTSSRGLSVAVGTDGLIAGIGFDDEVDIMLAGSSVEREVVATGMSVIPGLVDGHTHPVWVGDRVHEFAMKVTGTVCMYVCACMCSVHVRACVHAHNTQLYWQRTLCYS